ncbi:MAG: ferrous iron transport protein A [Candidatus Saganbacteria bacterium]|nr:ferrous iron transport protein A [Candidatus Saganbacteria bacterium]
MFTKKAIPLTDLKSGESGVVIEVVGGQAVARRLHALGVRQGKKIKKLSGMFMHGPLTVQVGHTQLGIGHGMASKIMLEV